MTIVFVNRRRAGYIAVLLFSAVVLGIAGYFANVFLPNVNRDFTIFALIVPSLNIVVFIVLLQWSMPRLDGFWLFVLAALWLAMGSWSADLIGYVQCSAIYGQRTQGHSGSISTRSYCYEMKVIEAFSWMNFCLLAIFFIILLSLTTRAQALGRPFAWQENIVELPWFGQMPGYPGGVYANGYQNGGGAYSYPMQQMLPPNAFVIQQQPGHSVVIQPQPAGQPPMVNQIPSTQPSVV
ncbi:hypothetical protein NEOLEDRAFT_1067039 [Neolentinus lepideus HHB14362 ss-1]|uniref:MARVEL domain-containing protein n=1 Tax=Neolentinus lepideus HHB14362 ss-1 TaxID=1314782 RepID=A0A165S027_9AGAM|nr:hypothetical protein NEOLEDRAFT_1067039 [Neolentinus lepideus HHB14362 ss-1]